MWGGGCLEPPLGARGGPTRAAGLPDFRGSVLSVPVVGSRVVPVFFRSRRDEAGALGFLKYPNWF